MKETLTYIWYEIIMISYNAFKVKWKTNDEYLLFQSLIDAKTYIDIIQENYKII